MIIIFLILAALSFGTVGIVLLVRAVRIAKGAHCAEGVCEGPDVVGLARTWIKNHLALIVPGMVHTGEIARAHVQKVLSLCVLGIKRALFHPDIMRKDMMQVAGAVQKVK